MFKVGDTLSDGTYRCQISRLLEDGKFQTILLDTYKSPFNDKVYSPGHIWHTNCSEKGFEQGGYKKVSSPKSHLPKWW